MIEMKLFYSWQLTTSRSYNRKFIEEAIINAKLGIEKASKEIQLSFDEATRGIPGSPNIPNEIFQKIKSCDIFICDLTIVNSEYQEKHTPNPNVLIELGFAVAILGWNRIIILCNAFYGKFPESMPFDIDRHRILKYKMFEEENYKEQNNSLSAQLKKAIELIIEKAPIKSYLELQNSSEAIQRSRDIKSIQSLFEKISIVLLKKYFEDMPFRKLYEVEHEFIDFNLVYDSPDFTIYDPRLKELISTFHEHWKVTLNYDEFYYPNRDRDYASFGRTHDFHETQEEQEKYDYLKKEIELLESTFTELVQYIKIAYLELDLEVIQKRFENKNST